MKIVNIILDTIAILILLAGMGFIGFLFWFMSLFTHWDVKDFIILAGIIAFVGWRWYRWDKNL